MKKIRNIIIILILILLVMSILLIILNNKKNDMIYEYNYENDNIEDFEDVDEQYFFYYDTVKECIQQFYSSLNEEMYYYRDEENNYKMSSSREINENIMNFLSERYIKQNNITYNNLNNYIKTKKYFQSIELIDIKAKEGKNNYVYAVHGIAVNLNYELTDEFYLYVILDRKNRTFAIEPINKKIEDFSEFEIDLNDEEIHQNDINTFRQVIVDVDESIKNLFEKHKKFTIALPELAYNHLDEEYREARFGSLNDFKKYVENNKEDIAKIRAQSYLTNTVDGDVELVIKDQYDNVYIFDEKAVLDYTVKLDTYTLENDKFNNAYKTATNKEKVLMNLDKFFQMLNANDYSSAYGVLSDEFKAKYFKTEDSFEAFVKQYMYVHANTTYMNYSDEISGVYTYYVELTDKANEKNPKKKMNIVMKLLEGTDFKISFEVIN